MKLDLRDRIILSNILPAQGSIQEIANTIECSKLLSISDKEKSEFSYHDDGQRATWNPEVDTARDIKLKHEHVSLLKEVIKKLDESGKVAIEQYNTFVKVQKL